MLSSYVCRQCKTRLTPRAAPLRAPQWQPRATFISLRNQQQGTADPSPAGADTQPEQQGARANNQDGPKSRNAAVEEQGYRQQQRPGRYSRHVRDSPDRQSNTASASSAAPAIEHHGYRAQGEGQQRKTSYTFPITQQLQNENIDKAWALFKDTYTSKDCEALTADPSFTDMSQLNNGKLLARILQSVNKSFCNSAGEPSVTPTAVLFKYEQLGLGRPEYWHKHTMAYLTHQVILAANGSTEAVQRDLPSLLSELVSVWRLFFQCMGPKKDALESISSEWNLPTTEFLQKHQHEHRDFNYRMQEYHPKYVGNPTLGFCAAYVFNLSDALSAIDSLQQQAEPFVRFLAHLLAGSRVNTIFKHTQVSNMFNSLPEKLRKEIVGELNETPRKAMEMIGSRPDPHAEKDTGDATTDLESFQLKRIARAVESKSSPTVLDAIWKQVVRAYTPKGEKTAIPPLLYNAFLSGFMVLFQSERCVTIWNHMISHGVQPNNATWVALLEGCEKGRDLNGFNATWQRMLSTGVEPDNYMWTTRIHGLVSLRQVALALKALDEMGNRWLSAEKVIQDPQSHSRNSKGAKNLPASSKMINRCTKPSIEVINGALTAIVQIPLAAMRQDKRIDLVQRILRWAKNFDIKPDTVTYNTLIQLYLQVGDYATGYKILGQMEREGIEADIATHTMLITAAFDNQTFDNLSETEQTDRLVQLFNELEAGGLRLNAYIYSTAIDRLLKQYSNHKAVRAMIDHMQARNLVPSAYIYTSLISHYFAQEPPAIEAVDTLVFQIFNGQRIPTDKYLFERTIQGYAAHGEVGKMMSVLTRMSKNGNLPGWRALEAVVRALVQAGDLDRARFIVRDCGRGEGVAQGGITGGMTLQQKFFHEAAALGVGLDEEDRMGDMMHSGEREAVPEQRQDVQSEPTNAAPEADVHSFLEPAPEPKERA
jgi:pentatricopeptide repeat protein